MIAQLHTHTGQTHAVHIDLDGPDLLITSSTGQTWLRISGVDWPALTSPPTGGIEGGAAANAEPLLTWNRPRPRFSELPTGTKAEKWAAIYRRFIDSPIEEAQALAYHAAEEYQRLTRSSVAARGAAAIEATAEPPQLDQDIAAIAPLLKRRGREIVTIDGDAYTTLIDPTGAVAYGAQSAVGRALGISNAGATNRDRILAVLDEIKIKTNALRKAA